MPNGGWIKLWRSVNDNPLMRRPAYFAVWMDILLAANHDEKISVMFGGKQINLSPGQFTTGAYQIAVRRGVPRGTVERILKRFKSEEMIEVQTDGQCSLITVKKWTHYQKSEEASEERVRNDRGTGEERVRTKQEEKKIRMKEVKKTIESEGRFNEFWTSYPRKTARKVALTSWVRLHLDDETVAAILKAVEIQKGSDQWKKDGGRFIPHPATWLNQERWKDEGVGQIKTTLTNKFDSLSKTVL